jgi:hypothetical protein
MITVTRPVSSDVQRSRSLSTVNVTAERNGHCHRETPDESCRNIPSAFSHLKMPHVFGKRLLGAYQMAEGIFLSEDKKAMVTVTKGVLTDVLWLRSYDPLNVIAKRKEHRNLNRLPICFYE